jgi:hypothetical protein
MKKGWPHAATPSGSLEHVTDRMDISSVLVRVRNPDETTLRSAVGELGGRIRAMWVQRR